MLNNIWKRLSSSQKISLLGSILLIISLFLNWFSDKDVFRSGDTYTALNGPLSFVGLSILVLASLNLGMIVMSGLRIRLVTKLSDSARGKMQMLTGFASMYLLIVINAVYFNPQFGLNILDKKSEIGVLLALVASVMICVGGYLCYRKKFEQPAVAVPSAREAVQEGVVSPQEKLSAYVAPVERIRPAVPVQATVPTTATIQTAVPAAPAPATAVASAQDPYFSERDPRGKTDYERNKLYENLKKTMIRDTLSPEQRRKLLAKEAKESAFSANFGKSGPVVATPGLPTTDRKARSLEETLKANSASAPQESPTTPANATSAPAKPQMYRMDL